MSRIMEIIRELKDRGVSGEYDQQAVTRAELAEALEALIEVVD